MMMQLSGRVECYLKLKLNYFHTKIKHALFLCSMATVVSRAIFKSTLRIPFLRKGVSARFFAPPGGWRCHESIAWCQL